MPEFLNPRRRLIRAVTGGLIALIPLVTGCQWSPHPGGRVGTGVPRAGQQVEESLSRAEALREQGLNDAALAEFERIIETNPTMTVAWLGAAELHADQGNYVEAEEHFSRAATLEPRNFEAQYGHGLMLQLLDRLTEAVRAYLRALTIRPNDLEANLNLATTYLQLGEPEQAVPYAERAVYIDGESGPARVNLGSVYAALGRDQDAIIEYQQAAERMELSPELLLNLANSYGNVGRYAEMRNTLQQLVRTDPSAVAYERLASAEFRLGNYAKALEHFRTAANLDPNHYPALNGIGVCRLNDYLRSGSTDRAALVDARNALQRSIRVERRQPRVIELLTRYQ